MELTGVAGFSSSQIDAHQLRTSLFDLFSKPKYSQQVQEVKERIFKPLLDVSNEVNNPIDIEITSPNEFLKLNEARLELLLEYQVKDVGREETEWKPLENRYDCSVVPLPATSMFREVGVKIGHVDVNNLQQNHYGYKAYLETLLEMTPDLTDTYMRPKLALIDEAGVYDDDDIWKDFGSYDLADAKKNENNLPELWDSTQNKPDLKEVKTRAVWTRKDYMLKNNPTFISTPLYLDFLNQDRLFPPGTSLTLSFRRQTENFYLLSKSNSTKVHTRIRIKQMQIVVPMLKLYPALSQKILKSWQSNPANYYFQHVVPRTFHLSKGDQFWEELDISKGTMPKSLFITFVKTSNYNGQLTTSPYKFEHLNMSRITVLIDGYEVEKHTLKPDFGNPECFRAYDHFLRNTKRTKTSSIITQSRYEEDFTVFAFDLTNDFNNNFNLYPPKAGRVGIKAEFPTLRTAYTALCFFVYTKTFSLDKNLNVTVQDI